MGSIAVSTKMSEKDAKLKYCCTLLKQCKASGKWPGYGGGIQILKSPGWLKPIEWGKHIEEAA